MASEPCTIAQLAAADFRALLEKEAVIAQNLCRHLVRQVRRLTSRIYEFSTLAVQNRIHADLLRQVHVDDSCVERGWISPAPKHAEIASRISTYREAVSREFSRLSKSGLITRKGTDLLINDIERLKSMVHAAIGE